MLVVFLGIAATFRLSLAVVATNKARSGAIALANERMEYIRSLPYTSIGTAGGIPSGSLAQSETVVLDNTTYTRRTLVQYADDSGDGLAGSDSNGITADYKSVRVDVAWQYKAGTHHITLVSRFEPSTGVETNPCGSPCGTLTISVLNAASQPVSNARVDITNSATSPAINLTTYTNAAGTVSFIGAPASSGYSIVVSKSGYSSAQTYTGSNPTPGALTVSSNQTTSQTFQIDLLSTLEVITKAWGDASPITNAAFSLHGLKTTSSNPVTYTYNQTLGGGGSATTTITNLAWDTYTMTIAGATGYDLASSCSPQPVYLAPGSSAQTILYLAPHTTHSLPVKVVSNSTGALLPGASVRLYKSGYDTTQATDACGQTFFSGLSSGTYSIEVSSGGYTTFTNGSIPVSGTTALYAVSLNDL